MAETPQRLRTRWAWLALLLLAAGAVAASWAWWHGAPPSGTPSQVRSRAAAAPVHTAFVETKSFPVVLNGLGTVQATNTVTVRSRVDGQIERVGFEEGQMVKEGQLLAQIDPAPFQAALDQAVAKLGQDQASLTNAKQDLQRTSILSKQGNATQQLLDQRTAQVAGLTAQVEADQAAIASAKVQLAYTSIKSPLGGRAGFRLVDPGNIVHANDPTGILTITQLQPISVIFTAPEQDLPAITEALQQAPLQVTAFSSDGHKQLGVGTLKLIDNQVDAASGTIRLKATFANTDGALWPGLSVSTRLLVRTIKDVVVVPDSAVQRGPDGLYAYVVTSDAKAELRNLKVGQIEDGQALVEQGLAAGERIITSGHYRVQAGGPVETLDHQERQAADGRAKGKADAP